MDRRGTQPRQLVQERWASVEDAREAARTSSRRGNRAIMVARSAERLRREASRLDGALDRQTDPALNSEDEGLRVRDVGITADSFRLLGESSDAALRAVDAATGG